MKTLAWTMIAACAVGATGCIDDGTEVDGDELGVVEEEIEIGSNDPSDPVRNAVVLVGGFCTGTLVAPNIVMTAGHCGWFDEALADGAWHPTAPTTIYFGPSRSAPIATAIANSVAMAPLATGGADWLLDDIVLLRLTTNVPATTAVPRPMYVDRPATLSATSTIYQIGYGGGRDRRRMTGSNYHDWTTATGYPNNGFGYTATYRGTGIGDRGTNIEGGDSGGPMLLGSSTGIVMGDLSHWEPYGIATFGPGGNGRPSIRAWLAAKVPQKPDFDVLSITATGCTGTGGDPTVAVRIKNAGARTSLYRVDLFHGLADVPPIGTTSPLYRLGALAPEGTYDMLFNLPVGAGGRWIDVLLDTTGAVAELNEGNNVQSAWLELPDCSFN